ncbi:hypothetical protein DH2020_000191 [Rehmannia glutinosa]|uniref:Endonuclease/exonuclease/phosphatase domain-containing protein n=1 Tax=Rehmannia glutinosa TaxID=99300 RepID=A0ABR0XVT6_REHGL
MKSPHIIFLSEMKCGISKVDKIKTQLTFNGFSVPSRGSSGGLALLWRKGISVVLRGYSDRFIDFDSEILGEKFRITGVYGELDVSKQRLFWNQFTSLSNDLSTPWLLLGDFNEVLSQDEFMGPGLRSNWQIDLFRQSLHSLNLHDLGFKGPKFTWHRLMNSPHTQRARLDRVVCNPHWQNLFPWSSVTHLNIYSDHSMLHVYISKRDPHSLHKRRRKIFRFEALWVKSKDCEQIIRDNWNSNFDNLPEKLTYQGFRLLRWGDKSHGNLSSRIAHLKKSLFRLQTRTITDTTRNLITDVKNQLDFLLEQDNIKWKQRAKQHWYVEGDRNTRFFHNYASKRKAINHIDSLLDSSGSPQSSPEALQQIITDYFGALFSSANPPESNIEQALQRVAPKVTPEMNQALIAPYTEKEIISALKHMHPFKSPGPDVGITILSRKPEKRSPSSLAYKQCRFMRFLVFDLRYIYHQLHSLIGAYWWDSKPGKKKIHWASWKTLSTAKSAGGLGFKDLRIFNLAMLSKQAWRLLTQPSSLLARLLQAKYYSSTSSMEAKLGNRPSWTWRSILEGRRALFVGCRKQIISGRTIKIWGGRWIPKPSSFTPSSIPSDLPRDALVNSLIDETSRCWKVELIRTFFAAPDADLILSIPISSSSQNDKWIWHHSKSGKYSVKSAYHAILDNPGYFTKKHPTLLFK